MRHDGDAQPGQVTALCFNGLEGCGDLMCTCRCHEELSDIENASDDELWQALADDEYTKPAP